jgi:hypothetical protein
MSRTQHRSSWVVHEVLLSGSHRWPTCRLHQPSRRLAPASGSAPPLAAESESFPNEWPAPMWPLRWPGITNIRLFSGRVYAIWSLQLSSILTLFSAVARYTYSFCSLQQQSILTLGYTISRYCTPPTLVSSLVRY